jgi:hypothetical protein
LYAADHYCISTKFLHNNTRIAINYQVFYHVPKPHGINC